MRATQHGRGVFTTRDLNPGVIIGDYLGPIVFDKDIPHLKNSDHFYDMYYDEGTSVNPSGDTPGIHLINHSCTPNTWMYTYHRHTLYFALRKIFKGEELTVNYLIGPIDEDCDPCEHKCTCDSPICRGSMHMSQSEFEKWTELENKEEMMTTAVMQKPGEDLKKLPHYPSLIPDHPIYTLFGNPNVEPLLHQTRSLLSLDEIRLLIRDSGRVIDLPLINTRILGVLNEYLISLPLR